MPAKPAVRTRPPQRPLKSPLAVTSGRGPAHVARPAPDELAGPAARGSLTEREATIAEYEDYLRTTTSRDDRPYEEGTINAYVSPARHLDKWMTGQGIEGDFGVIDTAALNRYFREYYRERGQGGTHTQQRNLRQLFNYLQAERAEPSPYTASLNIFGPVKKRPVTLSSDFVSDLLEVTGGGHARGVRGRPGSCDHPHLAQ